MIRIALISLLLSASGLASSAVGSWSTTGPEAAQGFDMSVSPAAPDAILLAASGAIFKSTNAGTSWTRQGLGLNYVTHVWMHPTLANTHLALSAGRLYRSTNGGVSWGTAGAGLPSASTASLVRMSVDAANPSNVLVIDINAGVFRSTNGGTNFTAVTVSGLDSGTRYEDIKHDPNNPLNVLMALCSFTTPTPTAQKSYFRSVDGGLTFAPVASSLAGCAAGGFAFSTTSTDVVASDQLRSADSGATWSFASNLNGEWLSYRNGVNALYSANAAGLRLSTDHGATFSTVGSGYIDNGVDPSSLRAIAFKPSATPEVSYLLSSAGSFFKSGAGTSVYTASNSGLIASNIRAVAVHPTNPNVVLAGWGDVGFQTAPALFRSTTSGVTWTRVNSGLALDEIRDIEIDPNTTASVATTVMYAAGWDRAPFSTVFTDFKPSIAKSIDGGLTWSHPPISAFPGIANATLQGRARNIAIDRSSQIGGTGPSQKIYFSNRGRVACPATGAGIVAQTILGPRIWKSNDAGANWVSIDTLPAGTCVVGSNQTGAFPIAKDIVIDPTAPNTIYVSSFLSLGTDPSVTATVQNGIFKSTDGGATWAHSSAGLPRIDPANAMSSVRDVLALVMDPVDPQTLYAASNTTSGGATGRVYKTTNGGANWSLASTGISGQDVRALLIDPLDRNKIYAATGGNSSNPGGVYFSSNAGLTWNSTSIALPASSATALDLGRSGPNPVLYAGTNLGLWDITQVPDLDSDGPPDAIESSAPFSGDGNEDGIGDANQANVASIVGADTAAFRGAGGNAAITLTITGIPAGSCTQMNDASSSLADEVGPEEAGLNYPFGVVRFELLNCARAFVSVRYHNQSFNPLFRYRNFGPDVIGNPNSVAWRDVINAGFTGNTWTFLVEDNTPGDNREETNRILFIGGPATDQLFRNGFE